MHSLLVFATSGGGLTFDDGDVVSIIDAHDSPGVVVQTNSTGCFSFVYVTDKEPLDDEMLELLEIGTENRARYLTLPGDVSSYTTYYDYDLAPSTIKKSWADLSGFVNDKQE